MNAQGNSTADDGLLTIAIPTYNRCKELSQLLEWIDTYAPLEVKVVVRDNASTDGTWEMLQNWKKKTKRDAAIFRNPENLGIDYNILKVAEDCTTEWFWWMGDDDLFDPDVPVNLISKIQKTNSDLIILNYKAWTNDLKKPVSDAVFESNKNCIKTKYDVLMIIAELFSFISILAVRVKPFKKEKITIPDWFIRTNIDFVYVVFNIIKNCKPEFLEYSFIRYRTGNENRGFDWNDLWIPYSSALNYCLPDLPKVVRRQIYRKALTRSIIPKLRNHKICSKFGIIEGIKFIIRYFNLFYGFKDFWFKFVVISLFPNWIYRDLKNNLNNER